MAREELIHNPLFISPLCAAQGGEPPIRASTGLHAFSHGLFLECGLPLEQR